MSLEEEIRALDDIEGLGEHEWCALVALLAGADEASAVWEGHLVIKARMPPERAAAAWAILAEHGMVRQVSMKGGYRVGIMRRPGDPEEDPSEWMAIIPRVPFNTAHHPAAAVPVFSRATGARNRFTHIRGRTLYCLDGTKLLIDDVRLDISEPDGAIYALKVILGYFGESVDVAEIATRAASGALTHDDLVSIAQDLDVIATQQNSQE